MERVWIGIGSNLLNPKKQTDRAIWALSQIPMTRVLVCSSRYRSHALGEQNQPDFLNMIAVIDTYLLPEILLSYLQYIELQQGRVRSSMVWQPRTLDLDILLFGKYIIKNSRLTIPHYDILRREFVMYPLMELNSNFIFPDGKVLLDCIRMISKNGLMFWED